MSTYRDLSGVVQETAGKVQPSLLRVPEWNSYRWLRAGFSCRAGGASQVYGASEQNLGWTTDDASDAVTTNRIRFVAALAAGRPMQLTTLHQVHGDVIRDVDVESATLMSPDGKAILQGDGLMTAVPGRLAGVITADCVPVLVADTRQRAVAAFHAGWRGTVARIVEQGIRRMFESYGSKPDDLVAAIGPAIGRCCFAVGEEVRSSFLDAFSYAPALIDEGPWITTQKRAIHVDLHEANRRQLLDAGLRGEQIATIAECTACTRLQDGRRKYFSYRAEAGFTGRMMSAIGVAEEG